MADEIVAALAIHRASAIFRASKTFFGRLLAAADRRYAAATATAAAVRHVFGRRLCRRLAGALGERANRAAANVLRK